MHLGKEGKLVDGKPLALGFMTMPALKPSRDAAEKAQFIRYSEEIILIFSTVQVLPAAVQTASQVWPA